MTSASPSPTSFSRSRRQALVMLGLLTTFAGLAALALGLPTSLPLYGSTFGFAATGVLLLFVSGGLFGYAAGVRRGASR